MKRRNFRFGYRRIAEQRALAFGIEIDKDTVRRVLAKRYRPDPSGPSWLTFVAHSKDRLWSIDFFRCESLILKTHSVMVVMGRAWHLPHVQPRTRPVRSPADITQHR